MTSTQERPIQTRLTSRLNLRHPILLAPMSHSSNGDLCASTSLAGGFGILGAAFTSPSWITAEFAQAQRLIQGALKCTPAQAAGMIGIGLVTFDLQRVPGMLEAALACHPGMLWLSFGEQKEVIRKIRGYERERGWGRILVACQVQTVEEALKVGLEGADLVVAQGGEAGGHGSSESSTFCLVPQVAAALRKVRSSETGEPILVVAAGGIVNGEGLAAALNLGADGVVMGTRMLMAKECPAPEEVKKAILQAKEGAATVRTRTWDILAGGRWPEQYNGRAIKNKASQQYVGRERVFEEELKANPQKWKQLTTETDENRKRKEYDFIPIWAGAGVGGFDPQIKSAEEILLETARDARASIQRTFSLL